mgnify:FL=1
MVMLDETTGFLELEIMTKTTAFLTIRDEKVFALHRLPRTLRVTMGRLFSHRKLKTIWLHMTFIITVLHLYGLRPMERLKA